MPDKLIGIDHLWDIIYNSENTIVVNKAVSLLIALYLNVSQ